MFQAIIRSTSSITRRMLTALQPRGLSGVQDATEGEGRIKTVLQDKFPTATSIEVEDISGGCGAMYQIHVESDVFKGKRTVQQHMMVNKVRTNWLIYKQLIDLFRIYVV
nr:bolA-like protein 3 [Lytechinus pictus]